MNVFLPQNAELCEISVHLDERISGAPELPLNIRSAVDIQVIIRRRRLAYSSEQKSNKSSIP